jgi:hypothetical protein
MLGFLAGKKRANHVFWRIKILPAAHEATFGMTMKRNVVCVLTII